MERKPHGQFTLWREGQILFCDAEGPFNEEIVDDFRAAVEAEIHALEHAPWAYVGNLRHVSVFTPEAEKAALKGVRWRAEHGMCCAAAVLTGAAPRELEETQIRRVYDAAGIEYGFFPDVGSARQWALARLEQVPPDR